LTTHDCDLCGSAEFTPLEVARPYVGDEQIPVVCKGCGFVYIRERRTSEEVIESWKQLYATKAYDPTLPGVRARLWYVAEWIGQNLAVKAEHSDLGSGDGWLSEEMLRRGWNTSRYDPAFGQANLSVGGNADIVTITWTLENCVDCIGMLKEARALLKPDGRLIVATGSRILVPPRKRMSAYFSRTPADTHCFRWSARTLELAAHRAGLQLDAENDWQQNDVLLKSFRIAGPAPGVPIGDYPPDVLDYFQNWARTWP